MLRTLKDTFSYLALLGIVAILHGLTRLDEPSHVAMLEIGMGLFYVLCVGAYNTARFSLVSLHFLLWGTCLFIGGVIYSTGMAEVSGGEVFGALLLIGDIVSRFPALNSGKAPAASNAGAGKSIRNVATEQIK